LRRRDFSQLGLRRLAILPLRDFVRAQVVAIRAVDVGRRGENFDNFLPSTQSRHETYPGKSANIADSSKLHAKETWSVLGIVAS
jgi:hypothetical protein